MTKTNIFLLFFILVSTLGNTQTTTVDDINALSQIILKGQSYAAQEFKELKKRHAIRFPSDKKLHLDSISVAKDYILFKSDGTFAYRLVLETHVENGKIHLVKLPFHNTSHPKSCEGITKSFKLHPKTGFWSFRVRLEPNSYYKSDFLAMPKKDEPYIYIYTFTSKNKGLEWHISLSIE